MIRVEEKTRMLVGSKERKQCGLVLHPTMVTDMDNARLAIATAVTS